VADIVASNSSCVGALKKQRTRMAAGLCMSMPYLDIPDLAMTCMTYCTDSVYGRRCGRTSGATVNIQAAPAEHSQSMDEYDTVPIDSRATL